MTDTTETTPPSTPTPMAPAAVPAVPAAPDAPEVTEAPDAVAESPCGCAPVLRRGRADHKESVRRVILDAARELFVCEGYGSVSLRKIAGRIGYTPMAIYVHFRDKSEILDCICEETFDSLRANYERLDALGLPPRERLAAGMRSFVDFGLEHPHHYQLTFMTPPCIQQDLGRREEIGFACYQRMRLRVAACAGVAVESPQVDLPSQLIMASLHGLVSLLIARPEFPWVERGQLIDKAVEGALRLVGQIDQIDQIEPLG